MNPRFFEVRNQECIILCANFFTPKYIWSTEINHLSTQHSSKNTRFHPHIISSLLLLKDKSHAVRIIAISLLLQSTIYSMCLFLVNCFDCKIISLFFDSPNNFSCLNRFKVPTIEYQKIKYIWPITCKTTKVMTITTFQC